MAPIETKQFQFFFCCVGGTLTVPRRSTARSTPANPMAAKPMPERWYTSMYNVQSGNLSSWATVNIDSLVKIYCRNQTGASAIRWAPGALSSRINRFFWSYKSCLELGIQKRRTVPSRSNHTATVYHWARREASNLYLRPIYTHRDTGAHEHPQVNRHTEMDLSGQIHRERVNSERKNPFKIYIVVNATL